MSPTTEVETYATKHNITEDELDAIIARVGTPVLGGHSIKRRNVDPAKSEIDKIVKAREMETAGIPAGTPMATARQVAYLRDLGATDEQIALATKRSASTLIDQLKANRPARTGSYHDPVAQAQRTAARLGIRGEIYD